MGQKTATIMEIAKKAGVTDATVSRALRNSPLVKEATRERVWQVAREMNYRKSTAGRGLATGKTFTLGLITPTLRYALNAEMAECIQQVASEINHGLLVSSVDNHDEMTVSRMKILAEHCVDGIVLQPAMSSKDISCIEIIRQYKIPFVVSADVPDQEVTFASYDNYDGVYQMTGHILEQGYRRPALITSWASHAATPRLTQGFHDRLLKAGLAPDRCPVVHQEQFDAESIRRTFDRILAAPAGVDCLLVTDSVVAMQGYLYLRKRGINVGPDFGLAATEDTPWFAESSLSVTTLRYPILDIARTLVQMLRRRIENPAAAREVKYFKPELIVRDSTRKHGV